MSSPSVRRLGPWGGLLLVLWTCQPRSNPPEESPNSCTSSLQCPHGEECLLNACVPVQVDGSVSRFDGGQASLDATVPDAKPAAALDAGAVTDAAVRDVPDATALLDAAAVDAAPLPDAASPADAAAPVDAAVACSVDAGNGFCSTDTGRCILGACVEPCGADAAAGYCDAPGTVCFQQQCTPTVNLPCGIQGGNHCAAGQVCVGNGCLDACGAEHPEGYCAPSQVCDGVECRVPCASGGDYCTSVQDLCVVQQCRTPCALGGDYCASSTQACSAGECRERCAPNQPMGFCALPEVCDGTRCRQPCTSGGDYCVNSVEVCAAQQCRTPCASGGDYCASNLQVCVASQCVDRCTARQPHGACLGAGTQCYAGTCLPPCAAGVPGWCSQLDAPRSCDVTSGQCTAAPAPAAVGDVLISEVLIDAPTVGTASEAGEYVELFNPTATVFNLRACVLRSQSGSSTQQSAAFPADVPLEPLASVVLRRSTPTGLEYDYAATPFTGVDFTNSSPDYVALRCGSVDVDGVGWNVMTGWPNLSRVPVNTAWERSTADLLARMPTADAGWCVGTQTRVIRSDGGVGTFLGTPAAANTCP